MRRCSSGSDLSDARSSITPYPFSPPSELKQASEVTSQSGSRGSGTNTPTSWADLEDSEEDGDGTLGTQCDWVPPPPTLDAMQLYEKLHGLSQGRSLPAKLVAELQADDTIQQHIPLDVNGNPSSLGSIPHAADPVGTNCKPCIFLHKKRCTKGQYCIHCHLPHQDFKAKRLRASKATRQRRAKMWPLLNGNAEGSETTGSDSQGGYSSGSSGRSQNSNIPTKITGTKISL